VRLSCAVILNGKATYSLWATPSKLAAAKSTVGLAVQGCQMDAWRRAVTHSVLADPDPLPSSDADPGHACGPKATRVAGLWPTTVLTRSRSALRSVKVSSCTRRSWTPVSARLGRRAPESHTARCPPERSRVNWEFQASAPAFRRFQPTLDPALMYSYL
jgi:hypothetical protein